MKITVNAAAKINLFLDITQLLPNGYHSLYTVMQSVGLYDTVELEKTKGGKISLTCSEKTLPVNKDNIAFKAAEAFFRSANIKNSGLQIHIEKRIPLSAGLAGGSADAAAVIAGLNRLFEAGLDTVQLNQIGLGIGADVPFCLTGGTMLAQDIGGVLSPLPALPDCFIVLAKPEQSISTVEAYKAYDNFDYIRHPNGPVMLYQMLNGDLNDICLAMGNVFEQCVEVPGRVDIKDVMRNCGALCSQMTGSGPSVFGIFTDEKAARLCAKKLAGSVKDVFVIKPADSGLEFA